MSHGDKVSKLPEGFICAASTSDCKNAAIADEKRKIYGLQFHPEVTHTENGMKILSNFVLDVCDCKADWTMENYLEQKIMEIRKEANGKKVFLLLSGGVDSAVCLALIGKAIGPEMVFALHIDTGFMRKGESEMVKNSLFSFIGNKRKNAGEKRKEQLTQKSQILSITMKKEIENLGIKKIHVIEAGQRFIDALECISDPEEKREVIGKLFVDLSVEEMKKMGLNGPEWLLGQGTIYPDTIETGGTKNSNKIKTHHNRAPIIMKMIEKGEVIEPLNQLYKDEVRQIGRLLGLPENLVNRHPFPGPGLAIRILCSDGKEKANLDLQEKINVKIREIQTNKENSRKSKTKQSKYSALLLPIKAVGVQGDNRTYRNAVLLQGPIDYGRLEEISTAITNSFNSVNRVLVLVGPEKIKSMELKEAYLTNERISVLQEADSIAMQVVEENGLMNEIWQFPVVLIPIDFNDRGEGIVLRPVESREAMTAKFFQMPKKALHEMAEAIMKIKGVGAVMLDVTHKPPATIEWE